jgi:hypothetical protein
MDEEVVEAYIVELSFWGSTISSDPCGQPVPPYAIELRATLGGILSSCAETKVM